MTSRFNIKDLDLIRFVAEGGSLTSAARRMHVSQSAISQRLSNLQLRLGARFFERRDGVMRPTTVGRRLLKASYLVSKELDATQADIDDLLRQRVERLRVTTQCYTCYRWLPFVMRDMHTSFPSLNIDVVPEATDEPYASIEDDRVDIAIVSSPQSESGFEEQALFNDELFAVMSSSHPLAKRSYLNQAQFSDQTLLLYTGQKHAILEEVLKPAGVSPAGLVQIRITEAIIELARLGQGIAILAGWSFNDQENLDGLVAVRILRGGFRRTWRAVINPLCDSEHVSSFVKIVRDTGKTIQEQDWRERIREASGR